MDPTDLVHKADSVDPTDLADPVDLGNSTDLDRIHGSSNSSHFTRSVGFRGSNRSIERIQQIY